MSLARHRELLVLGAVCSHDAHGYALADALARGMGRGLGIKRPTIYALLSRLQERGLVRHRSKRDTAYPERRVYRGTRTGRQAIAGLVQASVAASVGTMVPLSVVIANLEELPDADQVGALESCRAELQRTLDDLGDIPAHEGVAGLALDLLRRHSELDLEVVRSLLEQRAGGPPESP